MTGYETQVVPTLDPYECPLETQGYRVSPLSVTQLESPPFSEGTGCQQMSKWPKPSLDPPRPGAKVSWLLPRSTGVRLTRLLSGGALEVYGPRGLACCRDRVRGTQVRLAETEGAKSPAWLPSGYLSSSKEKPRARGRKEPTCRTPGSEQCDAPSTQLRQRCTRSGPCRVLFKSSQQDWHSYLHFTIEKNKV